MGISVDTNKLREHVRFLSELSPGRNYLNISSLNKAADYIKEQFTRIGLAPEEQKFSIGGREYKNIMASIGPKDAERIVLGAHYDVWEDQPGADDNASGVAGLIELARHLNEMDSRLKYRVDFVAYTLEEPPFFPSDSMGSAVHAKSLKDAKTKVKVMYSLEMIGYFSDKPKSQRYPIGLMNLFYPATGNFISIVGRIGQARVVRKIKNSFKSSVSIGVESVTAPKWIPGVDFSDHRNYWNQGFTAVMITDTAFYRNDNYHLPTDTMATLDFERMAEVVKGVYASVMGM